MTRRRILVAECKQEVSTFNPHPSGYEDFGIRRGADLVDYHRTVRNEIGGALTVFDDADVEVVPAYSAFFITSGGTLADAAWQRIAGEFLETLDAALATGPVDGVYFCMHGAMASEQELDPEGWLLVEARRRIGERTPVVVSLDLHGILTDRMLEQSDAIVAYHTYPHVDFFQTGQRAARLLLEIVAGRARPVTAKVAIPALVRGDELITATGRFGESIRMAEAFERQPGGLSAGMFIGNPFTDVPALQTYSFAVADDDADGDRAADSAADRAATLALRMAETFWSHHETMQVPLLPLHKLAAELRRDRDSLADGQPAGTLALVDAADATSSGASGDSNAVLRALVDGGYRGSTLLPIVDAPAAAQAFAAGVGGWIDTRLGGTLDPRRFQPLPIRARVRLLSDGEFRSESFGELWRAGPTAVLEADNFTIVVGSRGVNLYDRSYFYAHGQDPRRFDAVVVKSPHCQPHMYAEWCRRMLLIDAPGASSANLRSLGHTRCPRPIFPLDADVPFTPVVQLYSRDRGG
jgi:microcystin degradation protein MlrC